MSPSNRSGTLLNTIRAHLNVLKAATTDPTSNDVPPPDDHKLYAWNSPIASPAAAATIAKTKRIKESINSCNTGQDTGRQQRIFYMGNTTASNNYNNNSNNHDNDGLSNTVSHQSLSWSEQLFFSHDDQDATVCNDDDSFDNDLSDDDEHDNHNHHPNPILRPIPASVDGTTTAIAPADDDTCNNTIAEKTRQRSKKASRASTVGAFVTFLKALFGIGMLSNPAVLGEVGMVLGTFCHLFIVVGCAFACYLLLTARELAKGEVLAKEDLRLKGSMAALQAVDWMGSAGRQQQQQQQQQQHIQLQPNQQKQSLEQNLQQTAPPLPLAAPEVPSTVGWGRFQESLHQAVESQTPNSNCNDTSCSESEEQPTSPWSISKTPPRTVQEALSSSTNTSRTSHRTTPNRKMSTTNNSSSNTSTNPLTTSKSSDVSDEYQRFPDDIENHPLRNTGVSNTTLSSAPKRPPVRLVTYGDVAKYLAGPTLSSFVVFTIVTVHLMFASGMVHLAVENLCYVAGWDKLGYSYNEVYVEEDNAGDDGGGGGGDGGRRLGPSEDNNYDNDQAVEEEAYAEWEGPDFTGRLAMASFLFPIIHGLLQIPSLRELATISSIGLLTYVVGCIGSMMYTAIVLTGGHPFLDEPEDMWQTKWSGIPTYVATTIYAIEGINLALPTVSSLEGSERVRWGGSLIRKSSSGPEGKKNDRSDKSVFIVVGAVFLYGLVTLVVSWVGLAGGLGGGIGTMHGEDGCRDVTYCFDSSGVRFVYMLSLGVALILTLPVILYPSTEMLEIWLDEREDERRRKMLNVSTIPPQLDSLKTNQRQSIRQQIRHKSLIEDDDETLCTISNPVSPHENEHSDLYKEIEMKDLRERNGGYSAPGRAEEFTPKKSNTANNLRTSKSSTSCGREPLVHEAEATSTRPRRRQKYWKLRMFLAFIICFIGTLEGSFPVVVKAAEVIRGVGLSIAGLIFPPLLYMSAVGGRFSAAMASAMALLIGLGLFNIVLVLMSAFGETDYILEEGPGHFYNIDEH